MDTDAALKSISKARVHLRLADGFNAAGIHYRTVLQELDNLEKMVKPPVTKPRWADIGPIQVGGPSLLDMPLTHATSGIPLYPAVDTAWGNGGGVEVIAPEKCTVGRPTSSRGGKAMYLHGASGAKYWVGHLQAALPEGTVFQKGQRIGRTVDQTNTDHCHIGLNVEAFLGPGKQLAYGKNGNGPDYTIGSKSPRLQLLAAASV